MSTLRFSLKFRTLLGSLVLAIGCGKVGFQNDPNTEDFSKALVNGDDTFLQNKDAYMVDILFVDDNSNSMFDIQSELSKKFPSFTSALAGIDWQMGITTTDVSNGQFGLKGSLVTLTGSSAKIIKSTDSNAETLFEKSITRTETLNCELGTGPCPSDQSKPIEALVDAISKRTTQNAGFFRSGAELAVVTLSNADENPLLSPDRTTVLTAQDALAAFQSAWPTDKKLLSYGIAVLPGDQACLNTQTHGGTEVAAFATQISGLGTLTGGSSYSVCSPDYSPVLANIGTQIRNIDTTFHLKHLPSVLSTAVVKFTPDAPGVTWQIVGDQLILSKLPPKGTAIEVTYQYRAP